MCKISILIMYVCEKYGVSSSKCGRSAKCHVVCVRFPFIHFPFQISITKSNLNTPSMDPGECTIIARLTKTATT